jgi:predicted regulator of Ras-like GTPase activity (Roadblock/LC7/MglB family)
VLSGGLCGFADCILCLALAADEEDVLVFSCEIREEVGLEIEEPAFLASFPNQYPYRGIVYPVIDLFFLAEAREPAQAASLLRQILTFRPTDQPVIARIAELEPNAPAAPVAAPVASPVRPAARLATPPPPPRFPTPAPLSRQSVLEPLCRETGVRGALVADGSGQVVVSMNLAAGTEDLLAALAVELAQAGRLAMAQTGCDQAATWAVRADAGQVMLFQRNQFRVVVLADAAIRPAMLELRARQALIDLGAG